MGEEDHSEYLQGYIIPLQYGKFDVKTLEQ